MRAFTFRGMGYGVGPDIEARSLRASDLPTPMTNAQADRVTRDRMVANHRALLQVQGFGDAGATDSGDTAIAGGASAGAFGLGTGASLGKAVLVGVGVTVGASIAIRFIDKLWKRG